jgi:CHAT domain-containing protein
MKLPEAEASALLSYAGTLRTIAQHRAWQELRQENPEVELIEVNELLSGKRLPQSWIEAHREALGLLKRALRLYRAQADTHRVASTLAEIGEVNGLLGDPAGEVALHRKAWQWAQRHGNEGQARNLLARLADLLGRRQDRRQALVLLQRLLDHHQKSGDLGEVASIENKIAALQRQLGQMDVARRHEQRAVDLRLQLGQFAIASALLEEMAKRAHKGGDHARAGELFDRAVAVKEKEGDPARLQLTLARIGQQLLERRDPARALPYHLRYLRMVTAEGDRVQEIEARHRLARFWRHHGHQEQALHFYRQALARGRELRARQGQAGFDGVAVSLAGIGAVLAEQDQPEAAIAFYKAAINSIETLRERFTGSATIPASFVDIVLEQHSQAYRDLADLMLEQGRILEAQRVLELLKRREIQQHQRNLRAVASAEGLVLSAAEREVLDRHGSLLRFARRVAACDGREAECPDESSLNAERAQLIKEFNRSLREIAASLRQSRAVDPHFLDPERNRRKLSNHIVKAEPGTVVIYPLVLPERLWLLWIAPGEIAQRIEVPVSQKELGETVLRFRQLLEQQGDLAELKSTARKLHGWLVRPVEQELESNDIRNLVFALDRVVRYVPMAALHDGDRFLLEKYRISTILSAELTNMSRDAGMAPGQLPLLALGVSEGGGGFGALPFVEEEIDRIVREGDGDPHGIYPGRSYLDEAFDLEALRDNLHDHRALHIASHAHIGRDPGEAFLLMGNGRRLRLEDIQDQLPNLDRLELVVLSACMTALGGSDADGIEIAGLGAQFLQDDGARAVVASLWSVADVSTSELMQGLYRQLAGGAGRAEALRQAQLALIRRRGSDGGDFSHPFHWAPFVLIGNPR